MVLKIYLEFVFESNEYDYYTLTLLSNFVMNNTNKQYTSYKIE